MIIYVYSRCSTCKEALHFLAKHHIAFTAREISVQPPSVDELQKMRSYKQGELKKLFNSSGNLYREMQLAEKLKGMSDIQALNLLSQHGMLVKRPFLLADHVGLTGFKADEWTQKLLHE